VRVGRGEEGEDGSELFICLFETPRAMGRVVWSSAFD
jgi:hypothetical protein